MTDNGPTKARFLVELSQGCLLRTLTFVDLAAGHSPSARKEALAPAAANEENMIIMHHDSCGKLGHVSKPLLEGS